MTPTWPWRLWNKSKVVSISLVGSSSRLPACRELPFCCDAYMSAGMLTPSTRLPSKRAHAHEHLRSGPCICQCERQRSRARELEVEEEGERARAREREVSAQCTHTRTPAIGALVSVYVRKSSSSERKRVSTRAKERCQLTCWPLPRMRPASPTDISVTMDRLLRHKDRGPGGISGNWEC